MPAWVITVFWILFAFFVAVLLYKLGMAFLGEV
jgi:hypothetical protein